MRCVPGLCLQASADRSEEVKKIEHKLADAHKKLLEARAVLEQTLGASSADDAFSIEDQAGECQKQLEQATGQLRQAQNGLRQAESSTQDKRTLFGVHAIAIADRIARPRKPWTKPVLGPLGMCLGLRFVFQFPVACLW